jgi:hypothetical protein
LKNGKYKRSFYKFVIPRCGESIMVKVELPPLSPDNEPSELERPEYDNWGKEEKLEDDLEKPKKR